MGEHTGQPVALGTVRGGVGLRFQEAADRV
jgi:hypothetical protein